MNKRSFKIAFFLYIILILSFLQVRPGNAQGEVGIPTPIPPAFPAPALASDADTIVPDWRDITSDPFNLQPASGISNPVLTKSDVTDVEAAFVADPFLYHEGNDWYMFFEVFEHPTQRGRIGLARSSDGYNWSYDRIVLAEDFHLSYPYVFSYNGKYYMIPETYNVYQIRLYEAQNFPYDWVHVATLLEGHYWVDTSIFYYDNTWWMFSTDTSRLTGFLYYSDNLTSGWVEHPRSPYILNDSSKASPGGRAFVYNGNRIIRIVQKDDVSYGEQVRAFQVDVLTKTDYAESEISESPLLIPGGTGWNADGMHHYDPWWDGDNWIAVVDGINDGIWSIGIYEATNTSSPNGVIDSPAIDQTITVGQSVLFSGSATDPDNNLPFSYRWRFGEGSGIPDATVEDPGLVQFNTAGTYKVTFTVTDANGLSDPSPATRTVSVLSENATPTPLPGTTETPLPPPPPTATLPAGPTPTVVPGIDHSLWNDSVVPSTTWVNEPYAIEVGVKFIPAVDGYITGVRFYKGSGNTGPHVGNLWTATGERLASAQFTNETASGWQTVTFPAPVAVSANTTYVASYFSSQGNFAVDRSYFDTSYTNYPLTAPSSDLSGGNGVYRYGSDGGFPQQSYVASNYWVDVLFRMNQPEPTATEVPPPPPTNTPLPPPPPTATEVPPPPPTATEVPPPPPTNTPLPPPPPTATEVPPPPPTATDVPPPPPTATEVPPPPPTATEVPPPPPTATDVPPPPPTATEVPPPPPTNTPLPPPPPTATDVPPPPPTSTPTAIPEVDHSLWNDSVVPSTTWVNEPYAIEVGVKFIPAVDGYITGVRFYKGSGNTGPHVGNLWTATGERLASAQFTNETASGWQTVTFPAPVAVSANTTYVASYFSSQGNFAVDRSYFDTSYTNYPLTAPSSDLSGGNGVYRYGSDGGFPQQSYVASNYWVDVLFRMNQPEPTATEVPPPPPTNTPLPPPPPTATEVPPPPPTATDVPPPPPTNTPLPPPPPTATDVPPPPPTNTPLPPPTATEVPPPPPTNTPTPTVVVTSAPDLIFADGFESGDFQNWSSSVVDGGDLSVEPGAALIGNFGARYVIDDNNTLYVEDQTPASTPSYRARFYFDPNTITMVSGNSHYIFYGYSGTTVVMRLEFRFYSGMYQLRAALVNDSTSWTTSNWFTITDEVHFIELSWAAATAPKTRNGYLTLWIDGIQRANLSRVDNDTRRIDNIQLGPVAGIDSGTRGTYFFDAFESRTQTFIGN